MVKDKDSSSGVTGGDCKWCARTALKKLLPFFALFQKYLFQLSPFFNECNVLTSRILERSNRRTKNCGASEVITCV